MALAEALNPQIINSIIGIIGITISVLACSFTSTGLFYHDHNADGEPLKKGEVGFVEKDGSFIPYEAKKHGGIIVKRGTGKYLDEGANIINQFCPPHNHKGNNKIGPYEY